MALNLVVLNGVILAALGTFVLSLDIEIEGSVILGMPDLSLSV